MTGTSAVKKNKVALVTGITGQDGSYLAELLLKKGYFVVGLKRRTSVICTERIDHLFGHKKFKVEYFDLNDVSCMYRLLQKYKPDEIYNLAAQSHVRVSFEVPESTVDGIAMGTLRFLEAIRNTLPSCRFYQASSSEMFGDNPNYPFNEKSTFMPASPYACAKVFAHHLMRNYRESYGLYVCSGILFNHESPRRGETFVTRKITLAAANIVAGNQEYIELGNLGAYRDWGFAGDYVEAMWLMLQQDTPEDFVISTGETHSVQEFLETVFDSAGLFPLSKYIKTNPRLFRPHEVPYLIGDSSKAKRILGWEPEYKFKDLAKLMYSEDYKKIMEKKNVN
tara:strand:- start:3808 stop:4818 length:1011 start_codon:yes stop_codon:yes gene_type:complete